MLTGADFIVLYHIALDLPSGKCYYTYVMGVKHQTKNRRPAGATHASAPMTSRASGAVCEKAERQGDEMNRPEAFNGRKAARSFAKNQVISGKGVGYAIGYLKNGYDILVRAHRRDDGIIVCAEVKGRTSDIGVDIYRNDQMKIALRNGATV